jgi:hypothetical protein
MLRDVSSLLRGTGQQKMIPSCVGALMTQGAMHNPSDPELWR